MAAINAFSLWGVRIRIDPSWFIAFLLFAWTLSTGYFPLQAPDYPASAYWIAGTLSALALFGSVLIHELGHCVAARRLGIPVRRITLFIFGGVSEMAQTHSTSPGAEFRTSVAGPLVSFAAAGLFGLMTLLVGGAASSIVVETIRYLYFVNFLLAVFNLIPGFPLDGGRILRSIVWRRTGDIRRATRLAARAGVFMAVGMIGLGLVNLFAMHFVAGVWLLLIGLFLKRSAEMERKAFELQFTLKDFALRQIMSPSIAVEASTPVSDFVNNYVFRYHDRAFPVVANGRFIGMTDIRSIKRIPASEWSSARIGECLSDASTYCVLDPDVDAGEAMQLLSAGKRTHAPVVREGILLGMLTRDDLFKLVSLKNDLAA